MGIRGTQECGYGTQMKSNRKVTAVPVVLMPTMCKWSHLQVCLIFFLAIGFQLHVAPGIPTYPFSMRINWLRRKCVWSLGVWALELCPGPNPNSLLRINSVYWAKLVKVPELQFPWWKNVSVCRVVGRTRSRSCMWRVKCNPQCLRCTQYMWMIVRIIKVVQFKILAIWIGAQDVWNELCILETKGAPVEKWNRVSAAWVSPEWCIQQWFFRAAHILVSLVPCLSALVAEVTVNTVSSCSFIFAKRVEGCS